MAHVVLSIKPSIIPDPGDLKPSSETRHACDPHTWRQNTHTQNLKINN